MAINNYNISKKHRNMIDYSLFLFFPLSIYLVFFIVPNITSFIYSFFNYDGFTQMKYIGLQNFIRVFQDTRFGVAAGNTVIYAITAVFGQNILALLFALLLLKNTKINKFFRTLYYLPAILSSVSVGFIWQFIYDPNLGLLTTALNNMGLGFLTRTWLSDRPTVMFCIALVHIWQAVGGAMILFIAGLLGISNELYESAEIKGASHWQQFKRITFPLLMPTTLINVVLTTIGCFRSFDYVYVLTAGGGAGESHVLATWLFNEGFDFNRMGYASAIAVLLTLIVTVISITQIRLYKDQT